MTNTQSAALPPTADREPRSGHFLQPERGLYSVIFSDVGEHAAMHAAEAWLKARGFSVGVLQADAPRGVMLGSISIAKWRNLDSEDKADLHGQMIAPGRTYRSGPVTVLIRRDAPAAVIEAFHSDPVDTEARQHVEGKSP